MVLAMTKTQNVRRIVGWSVIAILLVFLGWYVADAREEIGALILDMEVAWIPPLLLVLCVMNLMSAGLWASLVRSMEKRLSMARLIAIWHQSLLGKYIPGSIWVHVGRIYHLRQAGLPIKTAAYASVIEQMTVLASSAFVVVLSPVLFLALGLPVWTGILVLPLLVASFLPDLVARALWRLGFHRVDLRMEQRPSRFFLGVYIGGHVIRALLGGPFLLLMLLVFGQATAGLDMLHLASIAAASFVIGYISLLTPGGIGVKEGILVLLLSQYIPLPAAVIIAVSGRFFTFSMDILAAGVASLYLWLSKHRPDSESSLASVE